MIREKTSELTPCTVFSAEQTNCRHACVSRRREKIADCFLTLDSVLIMVGWGWSQTCTPKAAFSGLSRHFSTRSY